MVEIVNLIWMNAHQLHASMAGHVINDDQVQASSALVFLVGAELYVAKTCTSVTLYPVKMEEHVLIKKEVISVTVNHFMMETIASSVSWSNIVPTTIHVQMVARATLQMDLLNVPVQTASVATRVQKTLILVGDQQFTLLIPSKFLAILSSIIGLFSQIPQNLRSHRRLKRCG